MQGAPALSGRWLNIALMLEHVGAMGSRLTVEPAVLYIGQEGAEIGS
jgi:hypothetical protein